MKKSLITILAAGLAFASCTNEELPAPATGEGVVTFTATLPSSLASRAYSDGTTATQLQYAIYESGTAEITPLIEDVATFVDLRTTVNATLATGKTYDILFWAQAPEGSPYTFDAATRTVTADYTGVLANDETLDAFFWAEKDLAVNGPVNKTVTLRRPFAQLNIGTTDMDVAKAAGLEVTKTTVTVAVSSTLDLYEGTVGDAEELTFALNDIPAATEVFPVDGCTYLAMNYLLVGADKQLVDVTFGHDASAATTTFPGVPVQRNYRTNIYGALLTNPAIFEVVIDKEYEDDFTYGEVVAPGVILDRASKTYTFTSPEGLVRLSANTLGKTYAMQGYTLKLGNDIDMAGIDFTPIAKDGFLACVFDGDNHTISNLTVTSAVNAAFIASNHGTIKNLTIKNPNITGNYFVGAVVGYGICSFIDNCHVEGGTITCTPRLISGKYDDGNNAGAITGWVSAENNASLTNCSASNVTVMAYRTVGALAGSVSGANMVVTGNTAEDCTVVANMLLSDKYDGNKAADCNELWGRVINNAIIGDGNTATNVTTKVLAKPADGNYQVGTVVELKAVESLLLSKTSMSGKTITIGADIDATGATWDAVWSSGQMKDATIDGGNHTITGLTMNNGFLPSGAQSNLVVKNLTFKDCVAAHNSSPGVNGTGMVIPQFYGSATFENVHVIGGSVSGPFACGGIIGQFTNEGGTYAVTFKNCSVENVEITADAAKWIECDGVGGANAFIGASIVWYNDSNTNTVNFEGCTATGNTLTNAAKVQGGGWYAQTLIYNEEEPATTVFPAP